MPPPLRLNHLNLPARDPEALGRWYVEKLGFRAEGRFLWSGGTLLVLTPGEPLDRREAHFGFRTESLGALADWVETLRERGLDVDPLGGDEAYSFVFFQDPEGNRIELFYERPPGD